jgi:hypothetical protein
VRILIHGSAVSDADFLVMSNMWGGGNVNFTVPIASIGQWKRIVDTQAYFESSASSWTCSTGDSISGSYGVVPRSIVVLQTCP